MYIYRDRKMGGAVDRKIAITEGSGGSPRDEEAKQGNILRKERDRDRNWSLLVRK